MSIFELTYFHDMQIGLSLQSLVAELNSLLVVADLHRIYIEPKYEREETVRVDPPVYFFPREKARTCVCVLCLGGGGVVGSPSVCRLKESRVGYHRWGAVFSRDLDWMPFGLSTGGWVNA